MRDASSWSPRPPGAITWAGLRTNLSVGLRYIAAWLSGTGAAAIDDLMEDAATAEISRAQVWQWVHHQMTIDDPEPTVITAELVRHIIDDITTGLTETAVYPSELLGQARSIFEEVALGDEFPTFLTLPAYEQLP